jgi:hypothetical protein
MVRFPKKHTFVFSMILMMAGIKHTILKRKLSWKIGREEGYCFCHMNRLRN